MNGKRVIQALVLGAALAAGAGCGDSGGGPTGARNGADVPTSIGGPDGEPACKLLTGAEVTEAIGAHDGGQHDYAHGGCVWSANAPLKDGFTQQIHAAVLSEDRYHQLAGIEIGDPIDGFGDGATYSPTYGQLWFPCGDQWCGIKAAIADGDEREQIAQRLARSLDSRR